MLGHGELEQIVLVVVDLQHGVPGGAGGSPGVGESEVDESSCEGEARSWGTCSCRRWRLWRIPSSSRVATSSFWLSFPTSSGEKVASINI